MTYTSVALGVRGQAPAQSGSPEHLIDVGATTPAAAFNHLAASTDAEVVVLLEERAQPGAGWLEHLLRALRRPGIGLAGPSTNRGWNAQAAFPRTQDTPEAIADTARRAALRYADATRSLGPLYSLGDFCYAVRRDVIDVVGAADEGYGAGPCWELDYNVRAARAGFRAVWVPAAYVHRAPLSAKRRADEAARFEASRRRYQDSFCGLRLRGLREDYEAHCRGDACEHFAPRELIRLERPLPRPARPRLTIRPRAPLVSCLMPTGGRPELALQAIRYFRRQTHPALELVVVDDGDGLAERLPDDDRIVYLRSRPGETIGAKRNRAAEAARGEIHALWDDDDWFGPCRIAAQVEPLLAGADVSGLTTPAFLDLASWEFWSATPSLHRRLFAGDVANGTLAYRRRVWERSRFPARSLAEDAAFLRAALRGGAQLARIEGDGHFAYVRHGRNSWTFPLGRHVDPRGWSRVAEPEWLAADAAFYAVLRRSAPPVAGPLVSCVMPTHDRPHLAPRAARYFLRQDYPNAELLVLDDGTVPVEPLLPRDPRIRTIRLDRRHTIGAKRNLGAEAARGELVAHWDDDDWSAPWRLSYQVAELERSGADVAGLAHLLFYEPGRGRAWRYAWPAAARAWASDGTLLYRKGLWRRNRFADTSMGVDCRFLWNGRPKRVHALGDERFYVGMIHGANTSPKNTGHRLWSPHDPAAVEALLDEDAAFYAREWPGSGPSR